MKIVHPLRIFPYIMLRTSSFNLSAVPLLISLIFFSGCRKISRGESDRSLGREILFFFFFWPIAFYSPFALKFSFDSPRNIDEIYSKLSFWSWKFMSFSFFFHFPRIFGWKRKRKSVLLVDWLLYMDLRLQLRVVLGNAILTPLTRSNKSPTHRTVRNRVPHREAYSSSSSMRLLLDSGYSYCSD